MKVNEMDYSEFKNGKVMVSLFSNKFKEVMLIISSPEMYQDEEAIRAKMQETGAQSVYCLDETLKIMELSNEELVKYHYMKKKLFLRYTESKKIS